MTGGFKRCVFLLSVTLQRSGEIHFVAKNSGCSENVSNPHQTLCPSPPSRLSKALLSWLPTAWPQLLQLLLDASQEVRLASAAVIGTIGAGLASRQPADQQRPPHSGRPSPSRQQPVLPPGALFEWALPALTTGLIAGRRQRILVEHQVRTV